jgi:hypothetical protein
VGHVQGSRLDIRTTGGGVGDHALHAAVPCPRHGFEASASGHRTVGSATESSALSSSGAEYVEEIAMALSDQLSQLAARTKEAEDRFAAAKKDSRDRLEQDVQHARETTQTRTEKLQSEAAAAGDQASAWADNLRQSWNEHVQQVRNRMKADKNKMDAKIAGQDAQDAEDYAASAIDFAYATVEEAEYACLYAALARADADDAARAAAR